MTTLESYYLFLDGIKKERTTVINIKYWNRLINESQKAWLKSKAPYTEINQTLIDDLRILRVVTDWTQKWKGNDLSPILTIGSGEGIQTVTKDFPLPNGINLPDYPIYFRMLDVQFRLAYWSIELGRYKSSNVIEYARVLRSDKKAVTPSNYYRRAKKGRLYYEIVGDVVKAVSEEDCIGVDMWMEYLRYPVEIWFDESNPSDHTTEPGNPGDTGYGSVPCELPDIQAQEIIDLAVRTHLERTMDQRLGSFSQEQQLK